MDAIVLCGGNGKRMGSLCQDSPKTLIIVRGKPILWFILKSLDRHNIKRVILPIGFEGKKIIQFVESVKNNFKFDIVCVETGVDTPISKRLLTVLPLLISKTLILINGDCIADVDFSKVYAEHKKKNADLTAIFCSINSPLGLFKIENDKPVSFERESKVSELKFENDTETNCYRIYSGICVIEKMAFDGFNLDGLENFEVGFFNHIMKYGKVGFFQQSGLWMALETPKDVELLNANHDPNETIEKFNKYEKILYLP
jgi:NDP-sugar pyrophosphorylase family protein